MKAGEGGGTLVDIDGFAFNVFFHKEKAGKSCRFVDRQ